MVTILVHSLLLLHDHDRKAIVANSTVMHLGMMLGETCYMDWW